MNELEPFRTQIEAALTSVFGISNSDVTINIFENPNSPGTALIGVELDGNYDVSSVLQQFFNHLVNIPGLSQYLAFNSKISLLLL